MTIIEDETYAYGGMKFYVISLTPSMLTALDKSIVEYIENGKPKKAEEGDKLYYTTRIELGRPGSGRYRAAPTPARIREEVTANNLSPDVANMLGYLSTGIRIFTHIIDLGDGNLFIIGAKGWE